MANLVSHPVIQVVTTFTVNEEELRALEALAGYGDDAFIKMFYNELGKHYLQPHEKGLREFLTSVRKLATPTLKRIDNARKEFIK
jgi:hypothetical protein